MRLQHLPHLSPQHKEKVSMILVFSQCWIALSLKWTVCFSVPIESLIITGENYVRIDTYDIMKLVT